MKKWVFQYILLLTAGSLTVAQEPSCICLEELTSAAVLQSPTAFQTPNDGTGRRFIAEQLGLVWIFETDDTMRPTPFMDISNLVSSGQDRGFLAFAFHPEYATNRKLYVYYSRHIPEEVTTLSEFLADENDPNMIDYNSERVLLDIVQPDFNHNGGDLVFGDDGYLYLSTGDGGGAGDPNNNSQNLLSYHGKMFRFDVDSRADGEYGIPPDNPFLGNPDAIPEIYAYGLRNPWRMTVDPGDELGTGKGRIFVGDVGQNAWEEVDIMESGGNYGWRGREGNECYDEDMCGNTGPEVFPIMVYEHDVVGDCVIGGYVYRGTANPGLQGWYHFGDWREVKLFRAIEPAPGSWEFRQIFQCTEGCQNNYTLEGGILSYGRDADGEIFFTTADAYNAEALGHVYKITQPPAD